MAAREIHDWKSDFRLPAVSEAQNYDDELNDLLSEMVLQESVRGLFQERLWSLL